MSSDLSLQWKDALALSRRQAPEFYEPGADIATGPHSEAIRFALSDLGLAGVFCIEGVPTIAFLREETPAPDHVDRVHRILWNQGLMSLLLVVRDDELLAYSLVHRPFTRDPNRTTDPRLIETLRLVADALRLRELIDSAESGRFPSLIAAVCARRRMCELASRQSVSSKRLRGSFAFQSRSTAKKRRQFGRGHRSGSGLAGFPNLNQQSSLLNVTRSASLPTAERNLQCLSILESPPNYGI